MVNFSLFHDDPVWRVWSKIRLSTESGKPRAARTVLATWLLTWLVPAVFAAAQGVAFGVDSPRSYLLDVSRYAQFWISVPMLILAEPYIEGHIRSGIAGFFLVGVTTKGARRRLRSALAATRKPRVEVRITALLLLVSLVAELWWIKADFSDGRDNWLASVETVRQDQLDKPELRATAERPTLAGWWGALISQPIATFFYLRWLWKILIWCWVLWRISRQKLNIQPAHPDRIGGLGILTSIQYRFFWVILAVGIAVAGNGLHRLLIERQPFSILTPDGLGAIGYFIAAPILLLAPLMFFSSALSDAKNENLVRFGALATAFASLTNLRAPDMGDTNMRAVTYAGPPLQSLVSLADQYERISRMRTFPLDFQPAVRLFAASFAALLPRLLESTFLTDLYGGLIQPMLRTR